VRAKRVGVIAGAFNPVTRAHVALAEAARAHVDEIVFAVPRVLPHKEYDGASVDQRMEMLRRVCGEVGCEPSLREARVEIVNGFKELKPHAVRVGDEHEIELLAGRLPNPTSAAGVVEGRIVEIENAVNNAGNFVRIRILDVDDDQDSVLAELVTADAKPRRRGARRVKPTAAEQTRQLRELAEDAARQSASRPPIGISAITEEEEAQDKALRAERIGEAQPDAIIIAEGAVQHVTGDGDARRKRRRRRRRGGRRHDEAVAEAMPTPTLAPTPPAPTPVEAAVPEASGQHRRRRRRRGRGGRGSGGASGVPMPDRHIFQVASDGVAHATGTTAAPEPSRAIAKVTHAPPPAVEAPPPSLSAPSEEPKRTKPARRRKAPGGVKGELEGTASALALPAGQSTTRRPRLPRKSPQAAVETAAPETPKRTRATRGESPSADGQVVKPAPRKRKSTASRKKKS